MKATATSLHPTSRLIIYIPGTISMDIDNGNNTNNGGSGTSRCPQIVLN